MTSAKTTSGIVIIHLSIPCQAAEWATRALFLYGASVTPPAPAPFPPQSPINYSKFDLYGIIIMWIVCVVKHDA